MQGRFCKLSEKLEVTYNGKGNGTQAVPYESQFKLIPEGDTTTAKGDFISHREISSQRDFIRYKRISLRL